MNIWEFWVRLIKPVRLNFCPDYPDPVDPAESGRDMMQAKIDLAPAVFRAESSQQYGQPAYAKMGQQITNTALYGDEFKNLNLVELGKKLAGDMAEQNRIGQTAQRENELGDVEQLGGRYLEAINAANPELTALRSKIGQRGMEALDKTYDSQMTDEDLRRATQGARQGYADRGMLRSNPSVAAEVLQTDQYRRYLEDRAFGQQQQDRNFALGAGQFTAATSTDPLQAVLGRPGHNIANNAAALQQANMAAGNTQPGYYDPFDSSWQSYMGHLNSNQQGQFASNAAGAGIMNDVLAGFSKFL